MNAGVSQILRCVLHETTELKQWEIVLPTVEMVINSLPNSSTGFSPLYLNYGHEPMMPMQLLEGNEKVSTESVASFIRRVTSDWNWLKKILKVQEVYSKNIMTVDTGM